MKINFGKVKSEFELRNIKFNLGVFVCVVSHNIIRMNDGVFWVSAKDMWELMTRLRNRDSDSWFVDSLGDLCCYNRDEKTTLTVREFRSIDETTNQRYNKLRERASKGKNNRMDFTCFTNRLGDLVEEGLDKRGAPKYNLF